MKKKIDVIVVNWNSGVSTLKAIQPLLISPAELDINLIIVDNASSDNSVELLENKSAVFISNQINAGFAKACNQAFNHCRGEYILLLNPDTESEISVLSNLVEFLEMNPAYGIAGPRQLDAKGNITQTCCRFPTFVTTLWSITGLSKLLPGVFTPAPHMVDWDHSYSSDVDHVIGSYYLVRRSAIKDSFFMDERFFMYFEDLDLSRRVAAAGYKCYYSTDNKIYHKGGGTGHYVEGKRLSYSFISRCKYWRKYFGLTKAGILSCMLIFIEGPLRLIYTSLVRRSGTKEVFKAYYLFFNFLFKRKDLANK